MEHLIGVDLGGWLDRGGTLVVARPQRNVARVLGLLGVQADLNIREA